MEITIPGILRIKPKALYKIGKYLRNSGYKKVALFYGEGIEELFGEIIEISFDSSEIFTVYKQTVIDNDVRDVYDVTFKLPAQVDALVAIGGGKVIDFCKYLAFISRKPVISVPTSISNDGFSSPMSSLYVGENRKSLKAKMPDGVIVDTEIIKNCPERFIFSGIGDLMSNITAIRDWKIAMKREHKPINDFAALISLNAVENILTFPDKNIENIEMIGLISGSLVMNGTAMEISQSSRPSSGSEHLISHALDKVSKNPQLHGIQVGVATYAISWLQQNRFETVKSAFEELGFIDFVAKNPLSMDEFCQAIDVAPTVKENFYTLLSEEENRKKLKEFCQDDEDLGRMLS